MSNSSANCSRILLLGPPASGKGTHGRELAIRLGIGYLSTGALLREHVETGSDLGKIVQPILASGGYISDDLMCDLLADWLAKQTGGWVLDGFPRSLAQAQFLDACLERNELKLDAAVALVVPFEDLAARISNRVECGACRWSGQRSQALPEDCCPKCGGKVSARFDDNKENFAKRYAEFERQTLPVIEHYRQQGILISCDATAPREEVASRLLSYFRVKSGH